MRKITLILTILNIINCTSFGQTEWNKDSILLSLYEQFSSNQHDEIGNYIYFNKDTILLVGYLSNSADYQSKHNIVYQSYDAGKNWRKIEFQGDAWVYCFHFENDGKVWIGGSDEFIHYSEDYGTNWTKKSKPFNPTDRVLFIYMSDSLHGIAGGLDNRLAITDDNWSTTKQLPTPFDQNKYKYTIPEISSRKRIKKVQFIDSLIFINQDNHIYFSKLYPIDWKEFNIPTRDFKVDKPNKMVKIYSIQEKVYILDTKLNLSEIQYEPALWMQIEKNEIIDLSHFLSSEIKIIKIKAVKYDFNKMVNKGLPFPTHKENVKWFHVKNKEKTTLFHEILSYTSNFSKPLLSSFIFTKEDFDDFNYYYELEKKEKENAKKQGGDYRIFLDAKNDYFVNPTKIINSLTQSLLDDTYKYNAWLPFRFSLANEIPYIYIEIINKNSDKLVIHSKGSYLFNLPWTIKYQGNSFQTYDTRITEFLKKTLPKNSIYYDKLFAGNLIYNIIEQQIINELEYENTLNK